MEWIEFGGIWRSRTVSMIQMKIKGKRHLDGKREKCENDGNTIPHPQSKHKNERNKQIIRDVCDEYK